MQDFLEETKNMSREVFLESYPYPFLIREATKIKTAMPADAEAVTRRLKRVAPTIGDGFMQGDVWIHPICPRDPDNFDGAVKLGRDADCDVSIADGSISAVHAHFTLEFEDDQPVVYVVDVGSSNGTFLNGDLLAKDAVTRLSSQDGLRFGPAVKFQFFEADGFFDFLDIYRKIGT
jgi:hypothetical protein